MDGPRDERDFKAELEVKTPAWLPGFRVAASFQRMWDKRGSDYANKTAEFAGIDPDELEEQLGEGGPIADLFLEGGRRVVESGDEVLRDAVTRLVAAALRDDARIHDASYLMKKLSTCEALHIRAICAIPLRLLPPLPTLESSSLIQETRTSQFEKMMYQWSSDVSAFSSQTIAEKCRASTSLVRAALDELSSFVENIDIHMERGPEVYKYPGFRRTAYYRLTELGADFRNLILTIDAEYSDMIAGNHPGFGQQGSSTGDDQTGASGSG